jgi:hypothetical protein
VLEGESCTRESTIFDKRCRCRRNADFATTSARPTPPYSLHGDVRKASFHESWRNQTRQVRTTCTFCGLTLFENVAE